MRLTHWIIIGLCVVIALLLLFDKDPEPDYTLSKERELQYKRENAILRVEKDSIQALQTTQNKKSTERHRRDSATIARQAIENKAIRRERDKARVTVQHLIDSVPNLKAFVALQDSLVDHQQEEIDTLKSALAFQVQINQDLIGLEYAEDKIEAQMQVDCERRLNEVTQERDEARKEARKKKRGEKLAKILIPVVAVGAFLAGSQL